MLHAVRSEHNFLRLFHVLEVIQSHLFVEFPSAVTARDGRVTIAIPPHQMKERAVV